jgi:hypothetical protein
MQPFSYKGQAYIAHVNLRGENHGEDKIPAYDIALEFTSDDELCAYFDPVLKAFLFNDQGFIRNKDVKTPLQFKDELPNYALHIDGLELLDMTLSKFALQPGDGRALHVACQARRVAKDDESAALHRLMFHTVDIELKPQQTDLVEESQSAKGKKDKA